MGFGQGRWDRGTACGAGGGRAGWGRWRLRNGDEEQPALGGRSSEEALPSARGFGVAEARGKAEPTNFAVPLPLESCGAGPGGPTAPCAPATKNPCDPPQGGPWVGRVGGCLPARGRQRCLYHNLEETKMAQGSSKCCQG